MDANILTFADLIAPIRQENFFAECWEKKPLHIRRPDDQIYGGLLTNRDVEAVISSGGLRFPAIQLAKGGGFIPPEAFTKNIRSGGDVFSGVPILDRIRTEYQSGATISLPGFQRAWKPLATLTAAMEGEFSHPVHANIYITPGKSTGFAPHYDTHEILVLQIAGRKRWTMYEPPLALPHRSDPFNPDGYTLSAPILAVDLVPGDLLYLPRGFVHAAATSDSFSMHVTLGITVYTWVELLSEWLQASRGDLSARRALPPGFAKQESMTQMLKDQLGPLIATLQKGTDYERLVDNFVRRARAGETKMPGEFYSDVVVTGRGTGGSTEM